MEGKISQTMITISLLMTLAMNVDAVPFNHGLNPTQLSPSRAHCKVPSSCDSLNGRAVTSASIQFSGGSAGSGSVSFVETDEISEGNLVEGMSSDLDEDPNHTITQETQEDEEMNDEGISNEIIRGGDCTSVAVMQKPHSTVKPSFTGAASVVHKNKLGRVKKVKSHLKIAKKLKNRNDMNLKRKVFHAGSGLFFATLNHILPKSIFVSGMAILTSATLTMELLRYRKGCEWMNDALHFCLGGALRKQEMEGKFTGSFYFFSGVLATSALFPKSCATLGICQLALADPSASFFGRQTRHVYWSRIENGFFGLGRNKGILGFIGGALVCYPFNYKVLSIAKFGASNMIPGGQMSVAIASLALGMAGAFADLCVPTPALTMPKEVCGVKMPPFHVDDNVVVPIISGFACTQIFQALGWTQGVDLAKFLISK